MLLYESEVIQNSVNPSWKEFKMSEQKLSKGDDMKELEVRFYNYSNTGNHTYIGAAKFTLASVGEKKKFAIKNTKK